MNKAYKYTLSSGEKKEITFDVGVNRLAISNANGTDGDVTIMTSEITKTDSGEICSFVDGADAPFADLTVNIVATQSGSGDPSPTNVRPISGFSAVDIIRTGKNLFGGLALGNAIVAVGENASINTENKYVTFTRSESEGGDYNRILTKAYKFKSNTKYSFIVTYSNSSNNNCLRLQYTDKASQAVELPNSSGIKTTIIIESNSAKTLKNVLLSYYSLGETNLYYDESGLFEGTITPAKYEIYNGETINMDWEDEAGTVYGGTLDVKTGELTVTHANIASYDGETINEPWISSMDVYSAGATPTTGAQVVYPLTTPVTYQLTPVEVRSLLGLNNVWADCGAITELKYFVQSTQPLFDYINDEDDKCVYIDCTQTGADTFSITSDITKAEFVSLLNKNKNVKLRLDTGSDDAIFDLSYVTDNIADFTYNRTALISDVNTFQSMTLRVDMSGDTLSLSRGGVLTIGDGTYEYITGQNNQLIKDGWSWSTQGYDLRDADELLFMITPMPNVASDSDTINGEMQRSSQDPKRALFCKGIKNMLPDVQEIESPIWFNDIVVVGNRATYTSKNDIVMKIRVWAKYYSSPQHSLADVNFYANCDCNDSTANLWGMCNVFVFKKKR